MSDVDKILKFALKVYFHKYSIYKHLLSQSNSSNEEKNIIVSVETPQKILPLRTALFQKRI